MSAFIVGKAHIDALVALAVRGCGYDPLRWYTVSDEEIRAASIAQLMSAELIKRATYESADEIGQMLWAENVRSIQHRYPDTIENGDYPGPIDFSDAEVITYTWPMNTPVPSAVQGLKAIDCYEYQSCEHDGWLTSEARRFCEALRGALIGRLPGYAEADWEIEESRVTV